MDDYRGPVHEQQLEETGRGTKSSHMQNPRCHVSQRSLARPSRSVNYFASYLPPPTFVASLED
jgi:hypothetical protein